METDGIQLFYDLLPYIISSNSAVRIKASQVLPAKNLNLIFLLRCRLKNFDPDNDDESLSNLETQCDGKEELQPLHGAGLLPADSLEYMVSGRRSKASFTLTCATSTSLVPQLDSPPACPLSHSHPHQSKRTSTTSCSPT